MEMLQTAQLGRISQVALVIMNRPANAGDIREVGLIHRQYPQAPPPLASAGFGYQGHQQENRGNEEGEADVFSGPLLLRALGSYVYSMKRYNPSVNALSTLIVVVVTLILILVNVIPYIKDKKTKKEEQQL